MKKYVYQLYLILFCGFVTVSAENFSHCFDVLDRLTATQIKDIYQFKVEDVGNTSPAAEIFSCFLNETRTDGKKTNVEKYFDVYKKCNYYKKYGFIYIDQYQVDELENLGIPTYLENHVRERIESGKGFAKDILPYIQEDLGKKIEMSGQYDDYKIFIRAKLKQVQKSGQKSLNSCGTPHFLIFIFIEYLITKWLMLES